MRFVNRADAGHQLGRHLTGTVRGDAVVLGLPRGGVSVAAEVARVLGVPLDVIVVRKLSVPWEPELALGAIGENGVSVLNEGLLRSAGVARSELAELEREEHERVRARVELMRQGRQQVSLAGRTAIVVDDGIATGASARAACQVARAHGASTVIVAVPVGPDEAAAALLDVADEVICLRSLGPYHAVGPAYEDFTQVSDDEVVDLLDAAQEPARRR